MAGPLTRWIALALTAGPLSVVTVGAPSAPTWPVTPTALVQPIPVNRGLGRLRGPRLLPPLGVEPYLMQGHALLATGTWIDAARSFQAALRLAPGSLPAWTGLAVALHGLADRDGARNALDTTRRLATAAEGDRARALVLLWSHYVDWSTGRPDERAETRPALIEAVDAFLAADPGDADRWVLRGALAAPAEAISFHHAALLRQPDHLGAEVRLAEAYEDLGDDDAALRHAEAVVRLAPMVSSARVAVAQVLSRRHAWLAARGALVLAEVIERQRQAAENMPAGEDDAFSEVLRFRALVEWQLGHRAAAEALLTEAAAIEVRGPARSLNPAMWVEWLLLEGRLAHARLAAPQVGRPGDDLGAVVGAALESRVLAAAGDLPGAAAALGRARGALQTLDRTWWTADLDRWRGEAAAAVACAEVWLAVARRDADAGDRVLALADARIARPVRPWVRDLLQLVSLERFAEARLPAVARLAAQRRLAAGWVLAPAAVQ